MIDRNTHLVRRRIMTKSDIAVDAEIDILERQLRDGLVGGDDLVGHGHDVGLPVFEGAAEFLVVG